MKRKEIDKDLFYTLYIVENLSLRNISKIMNINKKSLGNFAKEHNFIKDTKAINESRVKNIQKTCTERYGVKSNFMTSEFRKASEETCMRLYGVKNPMQNKEIREKQIKTMESRYGVKCNFELPEVIEKARATKIKKYGTLDIFHTDEIAKKIHETNLNKYGCNYPVQSNIIKEKVRQTCLERYGKEYYFQTQEFKDHINKLSNELYGTEWPIQSKEVQDKIKETNMRIHGGISTFCDPLVRDKIKATLKNKYGNESAFACEEIREKIKNTWNEKYGADNPMHSEIVKNHRIENNLIKYNKPYPNQNDHSLEEFASRESAIFFLNSYETKPTLYEIADLFDYSYTGLIRIANTLNIRDYFSEKRTSSHYETEIMNYIKTLKSDIKMEQSNRTILSGKEIDIYLPDYKFGIEFNGEYWHSDYFVPSDFHKYKTDKCAEFGVKLLSIYENEYIDHKEYFQEFIKSILEIYDSTDDPKLIYDVKIENNTAVVTNLLLVKSCNILNEINKIVAKLLHDEKINSVFIEINRKYPFELILIDGNYTIETITEPNEIKLNRYKVYDNGNIVLKYEDKYDQNNLL